MPKSIKKRIEKSTREQEDFKEVMHKLAAVDAERKQLLVKIGAGVLVALIVVASAYIYISGKNERAAKAEYEGYKLYTARDAAASPDKTALQPAPSPEKVEKALAKFKEAVELKPTPFSLFYVAAAQYELGRYKEAEAALKDFLTRYKGDARFMPLVYLKLAAVCQKTGRNEEALKYYDEFNTLTGGSMKDIALVESARLMEQMGKPEDAKKRYAALAKDFPDSRFVQEAKEKAGLTNSASGLGALMKSVAPATTGQQPTQGGPLSIK